MRAYPIVLGSLIILLGLVLTVMSEVSDGGLLLIVLSGALVIAIGIRGNPN